ncbi:MAG TPA: hypothetical protein VK666_20060 [Chryseolinea sp.]|nr:hypothetical protein [Chryseolinea sp.]
MKSLELINIFYRQNKDVAEYRDIFFETNMGMIEVYGVGFEFVDSSRMQSTDRLHELDEFKKKYGNLYIVEARGTYDNNLYLLISGKFILAIEYILNSTFEHSVQEFRVIENIHGSNKAEFDEFKELDFVKLPSLGNAID